MLILIECIIFCALFTLGVYSLSRNPIASLYNYPPKIQERVRTLEEYKDKIPTKKNKIFAKFTASVIIIVLASLVLKYINGCNNFLDGFIQSYIIWTVVNIYDVVVMDIIWFCHDKHFRFKGTEDMEKEYTNYMFHIGQGIIGQVLGLVLCCIIGFVVMYI